MRNCLFMRLRVVRVGDFVATAFSLPFGSISKQQVGDIPAELAKCQQLQELYLHRNHLQGKIPEALRQLVQLRYLYLYQVRSIIMGDSAAKQAFNGMAKCE